MECKIWLLYCYKSATSTVEMGGTAFNQDSGGVINCCMSSFYPSVPMVNVVNCHQSLAVTVKFSASSIGKTDLSVGVNVHC